MAFKLISKTALNILTSFFFTIFISSILLILNINISSINLILGFLISIVYLYLRNERKLELCDWLSYLIILVIYGVLLYYFSHFYEVSYDGNAYHGNAIVNLAQGRNLFLNQDQYARNIVAYWADYYPKATWIFGASLIKTFNFLSASLMTNTLISLMVSLYASTIYYKHHKNIFLSVATGIILGLNPIFISQSHTYYVDGLLGNLTILLLLMGYDLHKTFSHFKCLEIVMVSSLMIGVKFNGLAFAGLVNFGIWGYYLINNRKLALKYVYYGFLMLVIGLFIIGFSPYGLNIFNARNIVYPLMGSENVDIITQFIPKEIMGYNPVEKLKYSLFNGQTILDNLLSWPDINYLYYDQRIGGLGPFFGKLLVISIPIYFYCLLKEAKNYQRHLSLICLFIGLCLSIIINYRNVWWLRYAPQIWLFTLIPLYLMPNTKIFKSTIISIFTFLVLYQGFGLINETIKWESLMTKHIDQVYLENKNQKLKALIRDNEGLSVDYFYTYEQYRAQKYHIEYQFLENTKSLKELKKYPMHYYTIYIVSDK